MQITPVMLWSSPVPLQSTLQLFPPNIFDHSEIVEVAFCGVYVYHECDRSTVMGGITIATTDIWSIHCYREERNMRRQGDDSTCVRIRQGHRYSRETD